MLEISKAIEKMGKHEVIALRLAFEQKKFVAGPMAMFMELVVTVYDLVMILFVPSLSKWRYEGPAIPC